LETLSGAFMGDRPQRILIGIRLVEALREVLQGIISYMKTHHTNWQLQCVDAEEFVRNLGNGGADGAITHVSPRLRNRTRQIRKTGVPTVDILHDATPVLPSVLSDDLAIGRVGAEYFLSHGFRNFAFVGVDFEWSRARQGGFSQSLQRNEQQHELAAIVFPHPDYRMLDTGHLRSRLRRWVARLPKPVAIMTCSDLTARALLQACGDARVQVPDDASILGVDNLVAMCELASVPLSSVAQDFTTIGFEAARMLDGLLSRGKPPRQAVLVPPGPVLVRRSTDIFAFEDPHVANAMRLIHQKAGDGFGMKQLMNDMLVSRKWLDMRFKSLIGHTPSQEIRRVRLSRVRDLLLSTDLSVQEVANRCGFGCGENLIRFFRQAQGMPPHEYRLRHRGQTRIVR
jgi:LacI family transcriptional regulator